MEPAGIFSNNSSVRWHELPRAVASQVPCEWVQSHTSLLLTVRTLRRFLTRGEESWIFCPILLRGINSKQQSTYAIQYQLTFYDCLPRSSQVQ